MKDKEFIEDINENEAEVNPNSYIKSEDKDVSSDINEDDIVTDEDDNEYVTKEYADNIIKELNNAKNEVKTWKDKYTYLYSDFDTYKRRVAKEKDNISKYGSEKVIKDILPIIDDFDRAFMHMSDEQKEGISLIYKNFISILEKHDVTIIPAEHGDKFNDNLHEAVSVVPAMDDDEVGTIADCITKGYMLHDKVIRYAKVIVFN